jgi:hypothetical protein
VFMWSGAGVVNFFIRCVTGYTCIPPGGGDTWSPLGTMSGAPPSSSGVWELWGLDPTTGDCLPAAPCGGCTCDGNC